MDECCLPLTRESNDAIQSPNGILPNGDRFNQTFVDIICQSILANTDNVAELQRQIEVHQFTAEIVKQNLDLCSIEFDDLDDDPRLTYTVNRSATKKNRMTPFLFAVHRSCIEIVNFFLQNYQPNLEAECTLLMDEEKMVHGISALWMAVSQHNHRMVSLLLRYGADVNHCTKSRSTPLRVACYDGDASIVRMLVRHGADVNIPNQFRNTCLMLACFIGEEEVVRVLIDANADLNAQAFCGATALHFAAQQGHASIVKLLLDCDAKFLPNMNGFTPLFVAAESTQYDVVKQVFAIANLTTLEDRITACELLGASFATTAERLGNHLSLRTELVWLRNAFTLRYLANQLADCEFEYDENNSLQHSFEIEPNQVPQIAKQSTIEPISNYDYHVECRTLAELEAIKSDPTKMLFECFVILERILGPKSLILAEALVIRGAEFADIREFAKACPLWLRAIRIKINAKVFIGEDCLRFIRVLERMIQERSVYWTFMEELLRLTIEYYTLRPRLFGYRRLCYLTNVGNPDRFEDFTYNDLKQDLSSVKQSNTLDMWNKADSDLDSDLVMLSQLYLCSIIAKNIHTYPPNTAADLRKLVHQLCKLSITQNITGRTLLHLAMSTEPDEQYHYNNRFNNVFIRYPSVVTAQFLIQCGADVTSTDIAFNTPLHYLSAFCIRDSEARTEQQIELFHHMIHAKMSSLHQMMRRDDADSYDDATATATAAAAAAARRRKAKHCSPYYGGEYSVHMDSVNIFGQTPMQSSTSLLSDIIFGNSKQIYSLKCLAARAVHQRHLFCDDCRTQSPGKLVQIEQLWSEDSNATGTAETAPNKRYTKLLRYNQAFAGNLKAPPKNGNKLNGRFSYLNNYCAHRIVDYCPTRVWRTMNRFANRHSISLELAQFVEMHGPCKFLHRFEPNNAS